MFKIGDFSRLTRVTVKALRHYDDLGLLKPAQIDPFTGYRHYSATQIPRLNRILALKDLGLSLEQIGPLLDADLSTDQVRALLLVKQNEVHQQIAQEQERLQRIAARLQQIEQAARLANYDVVVKQIKAQAVASIRATLPSHAAIGELFRELNAYRQKHQLSATDWTAIWHDPEHRDTAVDAEATFASPNPLPSEGRVRPRELPAEMMACTVHRGAPTAIDAACAALLSWVEWNGYVIVGPERALALQRGGEPEETVTEIQLPVRKAG